MELGLSGLASGFDWNSLVDQLTEVERAPQRRLATEQALLGQRNSAYGSIAAQLTTLKKNADALANTSLFDGRIVKIGDSSVAAGSADAATALGTYTIAVSQLATASVQRGATNRGLGLNATNDVSGLVLRDAGFATPVTAGAFTVNGRRVNVETTDTLQGVFDKIATATGGQVTGSYNSATDKITLSSGGTIVLGSATDTSNFLTVAKLNNNGTGNVSSAYALGAVLLASPLATAKLTTPVTDGGSGAGEFRVNGVSIRFNAGADTVADVLARISNSTAGVTATYDPTQDRFVLTNKTTGDLGVALEDVSGNFLAAAGLTSGTLARGNNLLYTVNGGDALASTSNTITAASSGIPGLSLNVLMAGTTTVEVASDTDRIQTAITDFVTEYNKAQTLIDRYTASSTDADGKVTAGLLTGQSDAFELASRLRGASNAVISGWTGTLNKLADLGIASNGTDDQLSISDENDLETALATHLSEVRSLFTDSSVGLGTKVSAFLETVVGDSGVLTNRQTTLSKQIADIDTQISDQERMVQSNRQQLISGFVAMERAQAQINTQLQFLQQRFGS